MKWIGNKQKFASEIISYFPKDIKTYFEPFLGSGSVLAHLAPQFAVASDIFKPLMEIWQKLHDNTPELVSWYEERYELMNKIGKEKAYQIIKANYNNNPNGADLLFLSRSCYGGVIRMRKLDGYMSTNCGPHQPIPVENFSVRAFNWAARTQGTVFVHSDFQSIMSMSKAGDFCYLDPPYFDTQAIIYGAQTFSLARLYETIKECVNRGVKIALSIDGSKKSGKKNVDVAVPHGLFKREVTINVGSSMLRRFQMEGQTMDAEHVADRLLLTY